jgi:hypothetical protein
MAPWQVRGQQALRRSLSNPVVFLRFSISMKDTSHEDHGIELAAVHSHDFRSSRADENMSSAALNCLDGCCLAIRQFQQLYIGVIIAQLTNRTCTGNEPVTDQAVPPPRTWATRACYLTRVPLLYYVYTPVYTDIPYNT